MIVPILAAFLLSVAPQDAPPAENGSSANGAQTQEQPTQTDTRQEEPSSEPAAEEEETREVCRRVAVYDDFGRQRSRRVCRPR